MVFGFVVKGSCSLPIPAEAKALQHGLNAAMLRAVAAGDYGV
jgi:hypothetical protein